MKTPAITCHVNDTVEQAARLMWHHDIGAVIAVREDGKLGGVVTDRDICLAAFVQGRALADLLVHAAMTTDVVTVRPTDSLAHAEDLLVRRQLHRLVVVDADRRPVGMLALTDLALEAVQPDTRMRRGPVRVAHVLAAIAHPRFPRTIAA